MGVHKSSNEEFIRKAITKHGSKYEYSKTEYRSVREKVIITCPIHGDFEQTPESHLKPMGCFKCGYKDYKRAFNHTLDTFISKSNKIHDFKYDYSLTEFNGLNNELYIICPIHGKFTQKAKYHFLRGCKKCSKSKLYGDIQEKTKKFIEKANIVHDYKYDYSTTEVINRLSNVDIICKIHGHFTQSVSNHLKGQGCYACGKVIQGENGRRFTTETFKKEIFNTYPNIDFTETVYEGLGKKVNYKCKIHGVQSSFAGNLLKGHGCKECYNDKRKEEPGSWSYSSWEEKGLKSNYFEYFKVYIIRCWNDVEEFYKIGRTFVSITTRFRGKRSMPYKYEIIKIIEDKESKVICNKEKELKSKNKEFKYLPNIKFGGMYECFSKVIYE